MGRMGPILIVFVIVLLVVFVGYNYSEKITGKAVETNAEEGCVDSDDGKDYYLQGTITPLRGINIDYCAQRNSMIPGNKVDDLIEHYCDEGVASVMAYTCPKGCKDGACIVPLDDYVLLLDPIETDNETFVPCTDSDNGKKYSVKGTISGSTIDPDTAQDECILMGGKSVVAETYCYNDDLGAVKYYDCYDKRKTCDNGICVALEPVTESKDLRHHYTVISDDVLTKEPGCSFGGRGNYHPWAEGYVKIPAGLTPTKDSYSQYIGRITMETCDKDDLFTKLEFYCDSHGYAHLTKLKCENGCQLGACERD